MYSLVIGILAIVSLVILLFAMKMSDMTQGVFTRDIHEYESAVLERIQPVGKAYMPGDEVPPATVAVEAAPTPEPVAAALSGPQVYNQACLACHGAGIGGAPILGDNDQWSARIAKGTDTLKRHAIEGFTGDAGYMPPKGGRMDLSDAEIDAAVDYMIAESQ